ncbi:Sjogren's syndrome/scleroderma autoantigen 1 family protein [Acidilobus sp.]|uniref:Sjogren's syndrome/scleroderma autoantigen 1 family protein n=1 Tax=Acidilobus sp. TaxID=1872109 RepID=UPI003D03F3C0
MTQLMAQGGVMLEQTCPICGLPLFRLKSGDVVCPLHGKVYIVSSDEEAREVEIDETIKRLEYFASLKLRELMDKGDIGEAGDLLGIMEQAERVLRLRLERLSSSSRQAQPPPPPRRKDKEEEEEEEEEA